MSWRDEVVGLRESALALLQQLHGSGGYLPEADRIRRATLLYHLGAHEASRWMYAESLEHLSAALSDAAVLRIQQLELRCRAQIAAVEFYSGRLEGAWTAARQVVDSAEAHGWQAHHSLATAFAALGGVELFRGDIGSALPHLAHADELSHPLDLVNRFRAKMLMHFAMLSAGRVVQAREQLEALRDLVEPLGAPGWARTLLGVTEAQQLIAEGRRLDALEQLDSFKDDAAAQPAERLHWLVWRAEALLLSGRAAEARATLAPALPQNRGWLIHVLALVVDSLASDALGLRDEALEVLDQALREASVEQILFPFLRPGQQLPSLLKDLLDHGTPEEEFALAVLGRLTAHPCGATPAALYFEPLTARELEVLRAMQGTRSNEEVAQRLFVSTNTLRTHLKHINRKLGTTSRREAVARGRELALI
jgi:LuxR family maltose regulon positive regulatory protein